MSPDGEHIFLLNLKRSSPPKQNAQYLYIVNQNIQPTFFPSPQSHCWNVQNTTIKHLWGDQIKSKLFTYNILKLLFQCKSLERAITPLKYLHLTPLIPLKPWCNNVFCHIAHPTNSKGYNLIHKHVKSTPQRIQKRGGSTLGGLREPSPPPSMREANKKPFFIVSMRVHP